MSMISYTVERSCASHPLLNSRSVPRTGRVRLDHTRLFALGTLILQNSSERSLLSFEQTKRKWTCLSGRYRVYLRFPKDNIVATASGEDLVKLSEIVGVACGLAVLKRESRANINRFRRFRPNSPGKRTDFEFYYGGNRFFHESKGTTYPKDFQKFRKTILAQKRATKSLCRQSGRGPRPLAITGSISIYSHKDRSGTMSHIFLVDPPARGPNRHPPQYAELMSVLQYYLNFYSLTHVRPRNKELMGMAAWLKSVIRSLQAGKAPPKQAPSNPRLIARARGRISMCSKSVYEGTVFDDRLSLASMHRFSSFEEATRAISPPATFIGISKNVTDLIVKCQWDRLLKYKDKNASKVSAAQVILESGISVKHVSLQPQEEEESRKIFERLRPTRSR